VRDHGLAGLLGRVLLGLPAASCTSRAAVDVVVALAVELQARNELREHLARICAGLLPSALNSSPSTFAPRDQRHALGDERLDPGRDPRRPCFAFSAVVFACSATSARAFAAPLASSPARATCGSRRASRSGALHELRGRLGHLDLDAVDLDLHHLLLFLGCGGGSSTATASFASSFIRTSGPARPCGTIAT
jgi:hypothetical protein